MARDALGPISPNQEHKPNNDRKASLFAAGTRWSPSGAVRHGGGWCRPARADVLDGAENGVQVSRYADGHRHAHGHGVDHSWGRRRRLRAAAPPRARATPATNRSLPPEDAPLTKAHWIQIGLLAVALVIDVMKAATLGFVTPGMRAEYGLGAATIAVLPLVALTGTTVGSFIWGALADIYGRRASILLAAVMFVGTSICGAMPSFAWNVFMCFMMGLAAGGMLPVANALLAEIMPTKHRGWCLVLLGGIGTIGGYFATSELSALLQPYFGWRIMWLIGFPTGLILIALSPLLPESARFLIEMGRVEEARQTLARYGAVITRPQRGRSANARRTKRRSRRIRLASD